MATGASVSYSAIQPTAVGAEYNSTVEVYRESATARILRIVPDAPLTRYLAGQYGSLGLRSPSRPDKLLKRPYSLGSSILAADGTLLDHREIPFYEFFINRLPERSITGEHLTPLLFALKSGDRIFCGPKIVGFYTLKEVPLTKSVLLIGSLTGESPNNGIVNELLRRRSSGNICQINCGDRSWQSLYSDIHSETVRRFPQYRYKKFLDAGYDSITNYVGELLTDQSKANVELGFSLRPEMCQIFLCGDPQLIGAPKKLGAWKYEYPDYGLLRLLIAAGFSVTTKFQEGTVEYETYW